MATVFRIDPGQFDFSDVVPLPAPAQPRQQFLSGFEDVRQPQATVRVLSQVIPLDERLQPCGTAFVGEIERRTADTLALWHTRPVRAPYLAVDVPLDEIRQERVVVRVTHCDSYGLDYVIRGDVMGS
ncbi:MAG TPA: hypothetical protein VFI31_24530 [Pirellulales bacterium]|nr:hypothetical protein [Pirellulales bacterium]